MKRVVVLSFVLFMFLSLKAQIFVDGEQLKQEDKYLAVILKQRIITYNYLAFIELNKKEEIPRWKRLTDEKGKTIRFLTINEAIIYFEDNGYILKDLGVQFDNDNISQVFLLFEKKETDLTTEENNGN